MGSCVGIMMGIRLTDSDVVVVVLDVFVMPLLGVTNPLESGSTKEASKNCKRMFYIDT